MNMTYRGITFDSTVSEQTSNPSLSGYELSYRGQRYYMGSQAIPLEPCTSRSLRYRGIDYSGMGFACA